MITLKGEENKLCEDSEVPSPFRAKLFSQRGYLTPPLTPSYSAVEQRPARWAHNPKVGGSNPPSATNFKIKVMKGERLLDFIQSELLLMIQLKQLNNEEVPDLSSDIIIALSESILFEWQELGDPYEDLEQMIKWNLDQHISHAT